MSSTCPTNHLSRLEGHLPSPPEANPKGHIYVITIRSAKQLDEPKGPYGKKDEALNNVKGVEILEEKSDLVGEGGEQDKPKDTIKLGR